MTIRMIEPIKIIGKELMNNFEMKDIISVRNDIYIMIRVFLVRLQNIRDCVANKEKYVRNRVLPK